MSLAMAPEVAFIIRGVVANRTLVGLFPEMAEHMLIQIRAIIGAVFANVAGDVLDVHYDVLSVSC